MADLEKLLSRRRRYSQLVLDIARLDAPNAAFWQHRMNQLARACGCEFGAATCVLALIGYVWYGWLHGAFTSEHWMKASLFGIGVVVASAGVGKIAGRIYARRNLVRAVADLTRHLNQVM